MAKTNTSEEVNNIEEAVVASTRSARVDTVEANASRAYNKLEAKRKSLVNVYRAEKKVPVTISPFYAPYLGRVVRQSVNGIIVDIPADGQTYNVKSLDRKSVV